jgi:ADP-heptose:LPS heptosyltransferase
MRKFAFPIDDIKRGSNVIFYGAGDVGSQLLSFVRKTGYCNVLCTLDANAPEKQDYRTVVKKPEEIQGIAPSDYDYVLICLYSRTLTAEAAKILSDCGVPAHKLVVFDNRQITHPSVKIAITDDGDNTFRIAIVSIGGLGDHIISCVLAQGIFDAAHGAARIDFYASKIGIFQRLPFLNSVCSNTDRPDVNDYDAVMSGGNFYFLEYVNLDKAKRLSQTLYDYFKDMLWCYKNVISEDETSASSKLLQYCKILGKNRYEQANIRGILPFDRKTKLSFTVGLEEDAYLSSIGLKSGAYLTFCDKVHKLHPASTKMWPKDYFCELMKSIKKKYPDLPTVRIGDFGEDEEIDGTDMDLCCKTSFDEMAAVLKHSLLHVGNEGGLIHLRHHLCGLPSVCLFGPTSPQTYAYKENINLRTDALPGCSEGCEWIALMWLENGCLLRNDAQRPSLCMESLSPQAVFESIDKYLGTLKS